MRIRTLASFALALVTIFLSSSPLHSQAATDKKIFGYQDASGTFHSMTRVAPDATSTAATTGTFKVTINITVKSTFPSGTTRSIGCQTMFLPTVMDMQSNITSYEESTFVRATGSGTTYTCVLTTPYSWVLPTTAMMRNLVGSYIVEVNNSTASAGPAILRISNGDFASTSTIPATGTTTSYVVNVTI